MRASWWWIDRWQKSTAYKDMTLAEQGAYRNLLDELWLRGGVLPDDERILARLCGDATEWKSVRPAVMARFAKVDGGWRNATHDEVSAESSRRAEKQRNYRNGRGNQSGNSNGNGTGDPAGNGRRNVTPSPDPSPDQDQSQSPDGIAPPAAKPARAIPDTVHAQFIEWWSQEILRRCGHRPKLNGKDGTAVKAIRAALGDDLDELQRWANVYFDDEFHQRTGLTLSKFAGALEALRSRPRGPVRSESSATRAIRGLVESGRIAL